MDPLRIDANIPTQVLLERANPVQTAKEKEPVRISDKKISARQEIEASAGSFTHSQEVLKALSDRINTFLDTAKYSLQFIPNQETGRVVIKVLNSAGKVIREIPPEEMDRLSFQTDSGIGILVDAKLE
jgi:uncharacterized FlaG/YvyC family protein